MKKVISVLVVLFVSFQLNAQWVSQLAGTTNGLVGISAIDNNNCWIAGFASTVLRTTNGGTTWSNVSLPAVNGVLTDISSIYAFDANTCLASLYTATTTYVYKTTNGGSSWAQVFSQARTTITGYEGIRAIYMTSSSNGFMVGDPVNLRWSLWKTTDGGSTWDSTGLYLKAANSSESAAFHCLYVNGSNIWFGTGSSKIYYSANYGSTWSSQNTQSLTSTLDVWFSGATGIAAGTSGTFEGPGALYFSPNSGATWIPESYSGLGTITAATAQGSNFIYSTLFGAIYLSINNGISFSKVDSIPVSGHVYYDIRIARNGNSVWACGEGGVIRKGIIATLPVELTAFTANINNSIVNLNWSSATEKNNRGFEIQRKSSSNDFITVSFVNGNGTSTKTNNYSWSENLQPGIYFYRLKQVDFNGTFEYSNSIEVVAAPQNFILEQNFPNPFNPSTKIRYNIPVESNINIKVFNSLGENVREFILGTRSAGFYDLDFNSNGLSSGVYFYTIHSASVDGKQNFSNTKKMILLK
jgi:photosystem II stability/assembly factor-like uncharacterized protein